MTQGILLLLYLVGFSILSTFYPVIYYKLFYCIVFYFGGHFVYSLVYLFLKFKVKGFVEGLIIGSLSAIFTYQLSFAVWKAIILFTYPSEIDTSIDKLKSVLSAEQIIANNHDDYSAIYLLISGLSFLVLFFIVGGEMITIKNKK